MKKQYLTAREVAEVCGVSDGKAYGLIREMNAELKAAGYLTVSGKVPVDKELADEFAGMDKETIDKCLKIIAPYAQKMKEPILNAVGPTGGSGLRDDAIRRAMGLKV